MEKLTSCLMKNQKTFRSLDLTTICPKLLAGNPCPYCYVEGAREAGYNAKIKYDRTAYTGGILRLRKATIAKLNSTGGLRVFSFADYFPWMDKELMVIVADAKKVGLKLKAVTKQAQFVHKFAQYFDIIHLSIDNIGHGVNWETAQRLRQQYPNVLIRSVVLDESEIETLEKVSDIITLNHGKNDFQRFGPREREQLAQMFPGRVCGASESCLDCQVKCGQAIVENKKDKLAC